jgi:hypothetical protein
MRPVAVRILHPTPGPSAGPIECWVGAARARIAERHRRGFLRAGAADVRIVSGPPDHTPFGRRIRELVRAERPDGLVVLGSGAIPLASLDDRRALVRVSGSGERRALANDRFSADAIAVASASDALEDLPDDLGDNALPRWLAEVRGWTVDDLRRRWRLAIDVDGPLDLVLAGGPHELASAEARRVDTTLVRAGMGRLRALAVDPRAELLIAGRTSSGTVGWFERNTASRTRVLIEERGLRTRIAGQRSPASVLGALLERDGPDSLGTHLAALADGALVDTRVLLAHRLGADEGAWPPLADRFASDLLLADAIADPWLRDLTRAAAEAPIPILLGGHTLVGPGARIVVRGHV